MELADLWNNRWLLGFGSVMLIVIGVGVMFVPREDSGKHGPDAGGWVWAVFAIVIVALGFMALLYYRSQVS